MECQVLVKFATATGRRVRKANQHLLPREDGLVVRRPPTRRLHEKHAPRSAQSYGQADDSISKLQQASPRTAPLGLMLLR